MKDPRAILLAQLPPVDFVNRTLYTSGGNLDIQDAIRAATPKAVEMVRPIARFFDKGSLIKSAAFLHSFIRANLGYRRDPKGFQQIKLPNRYLIESGDCKSKALFVYSILKNLGYEVYYKLANYDKKKGFIPSHIYVVAFDGRNRVAVDGTYKHFNKEIKPNFYTLMTIQELSDDMTISGPRLKKKVQQATRAVKSTVKGAGKAVKSTVQTVGKTAVKAGKTVVQTGKKVYGAAPRGAFLALVALNVRGFATNLNRRKGPKLERQWKQLGGDYQALLRAIKTGANKKAVLAEDSEGISEAATVAASIASATPIIVKLAEFLKKVDESETVKAVKKIQDSKVLQSVNTALQKNPELKTRLTSLGRQQAAQVVNRAVTNATGSPGAGATAGASVASTVFPAPAPRSGFDEQQASEVVPSRDTAEVRQAPKIGLPLLGGLAAVGAAIYFFKK